MRGWMLGCLVGSVAGAWAGSTPSPTHVALDAAPTRVAPPGTATVKRLAQGEAAFLGRLTMAPGAAVPAHRDATEEYIHVLRGGGTMTIDGEPMTVRVGDTVFMPAGAEVTYTNGPEETEVLQVFAGPAPAEKYATWKRVDAAP